MQVTDVQRLAFLSLCGKKDKQILTGAQKMTFADFDRFTYLTNFFDLQYYNLYIWNEFAEQFEENFQALEKLYDEEDERVGYDLGECDLTQHDTWIIEFCRNVPCKDNKLFLKELVKRNYKNKGIELPKQFDKI